MMKSLSVLITGASGGIGSAIARRFAAHPTIPFSITLHGRAQSDDKLRTVAKSLDVRHENQKHVIIHGQVGRDHDWSSIAWQHVARTEGSAPELQLASSLDNKQELEVPPPFILVNAAGLTHSSLFLRTNDEKTQELLDVNLFGTITACRWFGGDKMRNARRRYYMTEQGETKTQALAHDIGPSIINVSSLLGMQGGLGVAVYAASKAGVIALSRGIAAEYGRMGIRVNTLVPGYIDTPMTQAESIKQLKGLQEKIPLGRLGTADEVADAAVFLAMNSYANNCVLNIDGGLSATGITGK